MQIHFLSVNQIRDSKELIIDEFSHGKKTMLKSQTYIQ